MAKNATTIAEEIDDFMKKNTLNLWTLSWVQLYEVVERSTIRESFKIDLRNALEKTGLLIAYNVNAIVIYRDANFAPQVYL